MGTIDEAKQRLRDILKGSAAAAQVAASDHFREVGPIIEQRVHAFWPGPDRPDIHIYATGESKASIRHEVQVTPVPTLTVMVTAEHAFYTADGYTRKGAGTANSWGLRGQQNYLEIPAVEAFEERLPALEARFNRLAKDIA